MPNLTPLSIASALQLQIWPSYFQWRLVDLCRVMPMRKGSMVWRRVSWLFIHNITIIIICNLNSYSTHTHKPTTSNNSLLFFIFFFLLPSQSPRCVEGREKGEILNFRRSGKGEIFATPHSGGRTVWPGPPRGAAPTLPLDIIIFCTKNNVVW